MQRVILSGEEGEPASSWVQQEVVLHASAVPVLSRLSQEEVAMPERRGQVSLRSLPEPERAGADGEEGRPACLPESVHAPLL